MSEQGESRPSNSGQLTRELAQPTIRFVLTLIVLGAIQFSLGILPAVDQVVVSPDITVATLLYSLITLIMFGIVFDYASTLGDVLGRAVPGVPSLERIVQLFAVLVVLVWAYGVFWWLPFFRTNPALYDLVFLALGVGVGGWLCYLVFSDLDAVSALIADRLLGDETVTATPEDGVAGAEETDG